MRGRQSNQGNHARPLQSCRPLMTRWWRDWFCSPLTSVCELRFHPQREARGAGGSGYPDTCVIMSVAVKASARKRVRMLRDLCLTPEQTDGSCEAADSMIWEKANLLHKPLCLVSQFWLNQELLKVSRDRKEKNAPPNTPSSSKVLVLGSDTEWFSQHWLFTCSGQTESRGV